MLTGRPSSKLRIKKVDESSLVNFIVFTIESEQMAIQSKQIIKQISETFNTDLLLQELDRTYRPKLKEKKDQYMS